MLMFFQAHCSPRVVLNIKGDRKEEGGEGIKKISHIRYSADRGRIAPKSPEGKTGLQRDEAVKAKDHVRRRFGEKTLERPLLRNGDYRDVVQHDPQGSPHVVDVRPNEKTSHEFHPLPNDVAEPRDMFRSRDERRNKQSSRFHGAPAGASAGQSGESRIVPRKFHDDVASRGTFDGTGAATHHHGGTAPVDGTGKDLRSMMQHDNSRGTQCYHHAAPVMVESRIMSNRYTVVQRACVQSLGCYAQGGLCVALWWFLSGGFCRSGVGGGVRGGFCRRIAGWFFSSRGCGVVFVGELQGGFCRRIAGWFLSENSRVVFFL